MLYFFLFHLTILAIFHSVLSQSDDNYPVVQVALLGDSLFYKPTHMWDLLRKIQDRVPSYNLNISVFARDSNTIQLVRDNQLGKCLQSRPQIVLMLWDTDVSNTFFDELSNQQLQYFVGNYTENLVYVINSVLQSGAYMAFGGPILLGEGWLLNKDVWKSKSEPLNYFMNLNINIANKLGVDYVNVREAFIARIPFFWSLFMGSKFFIFKIYICHY